MGKLRVGIIGAGMIAQVEHVPNILRLNEEFQLVGICDPSSSTRAFMAATYNIATFDSLEGLLSERLDAVVIASPDPLHKEHVLTALARGLHVFCEKPLCYSPADVEELMRARDASKRILQVGYMKRFDPAYGALLSMLPKSAEKLRQISVEVVDADAWPFVIHHRTHRAEDISGSLLDEVKQKQQAQVRSAVGVDLSPLAFRGFVSAYCSSLVHDVNAVHGILEALNIRDIAVAAASFFAGGAGGQGSIELSGGEALWTMSHLSVTSIPYYSERISLHFDDCDFDLEFPSPYLNHQPTRLIHRKGNAEQLISADVCAGYKEAFVEELLGFWSAILEGASVRNTAEHAARDMALLCDLTIHHHHARNLV